MTELQESAKHKTYSCVSPNLVNLNIDRLAQLRDAVKSIIAYCERFPTALVRCSMLVKIWVLPNEATNKISVTHFDSASWSFPLAQGMEIRQECPGIFCGDGNQAMYSQFRDAQAVGNLWPGGSFPAVGPPIPTSSALQDSKRLKNHTMGLYRSHSVRNSNFHNHFLIPLLLRWPWWMKLGWHRRLRRWGTRQDHLLSQTPSAARFLHNYPQPTTAEYDVTSIG